MVTAVGLRAVLVASLAAQAHSPTSPPPPGAMSQMCRNRTVPELVDVTEKALKPALAQLFTN